LVLTASLTRSGYIACPATHTDGVSSDAASIPEGARIQLDPSFNVDAQSWPQWEKVIAHALQTYGGYLLDTGGSVALFGESNLNGEPSWSSIGVPTGPSLSNLPWGQFRVLLLQPCSPDQQRFRASTRNWLQGRFPSEANAGTPTMDQASSPRPTVASAANESESPVSPR